MTVQHQGDTDPVDSKTINAVATVHNLNPNRLAEVCQKVQNDACYKYAEYTEQGTTQAIVDDRLFVKVDTSEWEAIIEHFEVPVEVDNPQEYLQATRTCYNQQLIDESERGNTSKGPRFGTGDMMILPAPGHDDYDYELELQEG